jgi:hypothetical protein
MTTPTLCPACGQPLPRAKRRGPRSMSTHPDAQTRSLPTRLRALYGDGRPFGADDAARELGASFAVVSATLRRMKDAQRVDALSSPSGQWVGEWRLTTPTP